jgi:hypothetical protein
MRFAGLCFSILLILAAAWPSPADESVARNTSPLWEATARAAASSPPPQAAFEVARARLESSLQQLRQFLATGGSQKETRWAQWLELPALEAQLTANQPDIDILGRHLVRLRQNQHGLELPAFVAVRQELRRYALASEYFTADAPDDLFRRRLEELSDCLARLDATPTAPDAQRAGRLVSWFESLGGESAQLAAAVRQEYCRTNAVAQSSARLINLLLERSVESQQFIAEMMLGSYTQGMAFTRAQVSFDFLPSQEHATFVLRMNGQTICPANVAQSGRVSVYTSAVTNINANKQVFLNDDGLRLAPATASAATSVQLNNIEAGRRIVERIAWRRASRMMPQAEAATAQRVQTQANSSLDEQAAAALTGVNDLVRHQIRAPLIRRNALPEEWLFWTDREHLRVSLAQHNDSQLAVATPAPEFPSSYDVAVSAHESMIVNLSEAMLGGETIKDQTWLEFSKQLSGEEPRALWVHDRTPRWSVTLEHELPVVARFSDDRIVFTIRLAKVTRGNAIFEHPIEIEARFIPQSTRDGPALTRDGDLAIRFTDPIKPDGWQAMQMFLMQKSGAVFPAELVFHGMSPPSGGALGKLNLLQLAEFKSTDGWLTVAYELKSAHQPDTLAANNNSMPSRPSATSPLR